MSIREQKKYLEILKKHERRFTPKELEDYKMFQKRHKDDEDFDKFSMQRLIALYEKYHINRVKPNLDNLFKKPEADSEEN